MKTILFVVDGSPLACAASYEVIYLAKASPSKIIAQFIIDPQRLFDLQGFEGEGLCGSGVFIETEQELIPPLVRLGETLLMSFTARAEGAGVDVEVFVDVGNPAREIASRATDCDLVALPATAANSTLSNELVDLIACPILLVQSQIDGMLLEPKAAA